MIDFEPRELPYVSKHHTYFFIEKDTIQYILEYKIMDILLYFYEKNFPPSWSFMNLVLHFFIYAKSIYFI